MRLTMHESEKYRKLAADHRATDDEKRLLSTTASLIAAGESVSKADYLSCEALAGGALSLVTPIAGRK